MMSKKQWVNNRKKNYLKRMMSEEQWIISAPQQDGMRFKEIPNPVIFNLWQLDEKLRLFVPSLFSKIKATKDEVIVEVPHQVALKFVKYLHDHCCLGITIRVIGV